MGEDVRQNDSNEDQAAYSCKNNYRLYLNNTASASSAYTNVNIFNVSEKKIVVDHVLDVYSSVACSGSFSSFKLNSAEEYFTDPKLEYIYQ